MERDYIIAGLRIRMDTWGRTAAQAEPYLTETAGEADMIVTSNAEEFHKKQPQLSLDDCEYLTTGGSFYRQLMEFDGMMIHSSAVVLDGYAYLFSAPCGTGKSTHTNLWRDVFGHDKVIMLNDDKPAVREEDGRWYAYGTPWSGKTGQNTNARVPIGGICILTRGEVNEIVPFGGAQAAQAVMEQTSRPITMVGRIKMLEMVDRLITNVPFWKLTCTPTYDAARVSQKAMSEEAKKRFG